jgi:hypothetical protein
VIRVLGKVGNTVPRPEPGARARTRRQMTSTSLRIDPVDPLRDAEWDRTILAHPSAGIFHGTAWARVLCKTYGHTPVYLRCSRGSDLVALVPLMEIASRVTGRRGVCLPFADYCTPLMFDSRGLDEVMETLFATARARRWKHIELRGQARAAAPSGNPLFMPPASATPALAFYGHSLDLRRGENDLLSRCDGSVRRAIAKAERSDLRVRIDRSREGVIAFYKLHVRTRRRHGVPPQPLSFFLNIHAEIIEPGLGFVVLAEEESKPVAAAMFFDSGSQAMFKFGASDDSRQELRGNNLVMWEAIKFLAKSGCETLDFGRTSLDNEGLRRFKLGWGTAEKIISYFRFDPAAGTWVRARDHASGFHTAFFRRLPLPLNRLAGAILYRHLD